MSDVSTARFDRRTRVCGAIAGLEAGLLALYCVSLAYAALDSTGATESAPIVEIVIFLVFAIGIGMVSRGMFGGSANARAPYILTQIFVLIVAYTLFVGDGPVVTAAGVIVGVIGGLGIVAGAVAISAASDEPNGSTTQS